MAAPFYLDIDITDAKNTLNALALVHTPEELQTIYKRAIRRVAGTVRRIVSSDVPQHYVVSSGQVRQAIGSPKFGGMISFSCVIPIRDHRGSIGGRYKATGGLPGWASLTSGHYDINAAIVRGGTSRLPTNMSHQGGQPPFINTSAPKLNGVAFTRKGKDQPGQKAPISAIVGLAIPQMPMNRAQGDVQREIMSALIDRLEREHAYMIGAVGK